jgi:hypothetical protein
LLLTLGWSETRRERRRRCRRWGRRLAGVDDGGGEDELEKVQTLACTAP